jgi:transcription initiation factor IIE alpha subunit
VRGVSDFECPRCGKPYSEVDKWELDPLMQVNDDDRKEVRHGTYFLITRSSLDDNHHVVDR